MKIEIHNINGVEIAEIISEKIVIHKVEDGLNLMGDLYYQGFDKIILKEECITPDFFILKNGIAGEILQKFSTYRVRLAIIGDFSKYISNSLADFIYESNKGKHVNFVTTLSEAIKALST